MISYKELVKKTMPPEKEATAKKCIVGHYLVRPICNVFSIPLIEKRVNPTLITIISGLVLLIAFGCFIIPGDIGFFLGWILIFIWNVLDGIDGNIARYNDACSDYGEMWESATGWLAIVVFYYGMGFTAFYNQGKTFGFIAAIPEYIYLFLGALAAMCWIFPRLVMYKKAYILGNRSATSLNRGNYGGIRLIVFNITSINGFASVLFLLMYVMELNAFCMIMYFLISFAACAGSLKELLKHKDFNEKRG